MNSNIQVQANAICKHVSTLIDNRRVTPGIVREIQGWLYNSGPEWTVQRLKSLKTATIQYLATEHDKQKDLRRFPCPKWVARDNRGFPKGALGSYIRDHVDGSNSELGILLSVLNTYTVFIAPASTKTQKEKFLRAINGPKPNGFDRKGLMAAANACEACKGDISEYSKIFLSSYSETFSLAGLNTAKPSLNPRRRNTKTVRTSRSPSGEVKKTVDAEWHPWVLSFVESTMVTGPWTSILQSMGVPTISGANPPPYVGRITVLQERGYKARVIAMPVAGAQVAFKPLHTALNKILRRIPQDCTHNQSDGVRWAEKQLADGKRCHAVDLSSATDNFPLTFQLEVLRVLGYPRVDEFRQMCTSQYASEFGNLTYTKGQPMGLYGSFSLFALSHHILIKYCESACGRSDTYRILGDDIIISDSEVAQKYKLLLNALNIPVSLEKCVTSDLLTEFGGAVIVPNGTIPTVKAPKSNGRLITCSGFINYCRVTGRISRIAAVPKQYRTIAKALAALPQSYGGAGVNPEGLPLESRISTLIDALSQASLPLSRDLRGTLLKFAFGKHIWVSKIVTFINDQLTKRDEAIRTMLTKKSPDLINLGTELHSLVMQVFGDEADGLVYDGRLFDQSNDDTVQQWRNLSKKFKETSVSNDVSKGTLVETWHRDF